MSAEANAEGLGTLLVLAVILTAWAGWARFFSLPPPLISSPFRMVRCVGGAFLLYFLYMFLVTPLAYGVITHIVPSIAQPTPFLWFTYISMIGLAGVLTCYVFWMREELRALILWGGRAPSWELFGTSVGWGCVGWAVGYPWAVCIHRGVEWLLWKTLGFTGGEPQEAVRALKSTRGAGGLFALSAFTLVLVIPFIEELLFRGFLQTLLRRVVGRAFAIVLSAALFAVMHYSVGLGLGNVSLIITLFVLALFLGFVYDRQQTLWAPWALHLAFNATTVFSITL